MSYTNDVEDNLQASSKSPAYDGKVITEGFQNYPKIKFTVSYLQKHFSIHSTLLVHIITQILNFSNV